MQFLSPFIPNHKKHLIITIFAFLFFLGWWYPIKMILSQVIYFFPPHLIHRGLDSCNTTSLINVCFFLNLNHIPVDLSLLGEEEEL